MVRRIPALDRVPDDRYAVACREHFGVNEHRLGAFAIFDAGATRTSTENPSSLTMTLTFGTENIVVRRLCSQLDGLSQALCDVPGQ
jgi:hypothetical protein